MTIQTQQLNDAIALHIGRLTIENTAMKVQIEGLQQQVQALSAKVEELQPPASPPEAADLPDLEPES
jgi:hypothetical protein